MNSAEIGVPSFLGSPTLNLNQNSPKTLGKMRGYLFESQHVLKLLKSHRGHCTLDGALEFTGFLKESQPAKAMVVLVNSPGSQWCLWFAQSVSF